jgi:hypothetical protein
VLQYRQGRAKMPGDVEKRLKKLNLFADLRRNDLRAVAALVKRGEYQAGEIICRQGETGHSVYIVESGDLRVLHIDAMGVERVVDRLGPGDYFGETSLLLGEPRDATVQAIRDSALLRLHRDNFEPLLDQRPSVLRNLALRSDVAQKYRVRRLRFKWQDPDETIVVSQHRHNAILARSIAAPCLVLLAVALGFGYWYLQPDRTIAPLKILSLAYDLALIPMSLILYLTVDHMDDIYIVTNKRVVRREQTPFGKESRIEAPLRTIQNIQESRVGLLSEAYNFGDLLIETAGERGHVAFREVPNPSDIREIIFEQKERLAAEVKFEERAAIRKDMRRYFEVQLDEEEPTETVKAPAERPSRSRILPWLGAPFRVMGYFLPALRSEQGDTITWRKHWIALIQPIALPTLLMAIATVVAVLLLTQVSEVWGPVLIGYGVTIAILFPWWLWRFDDWQNDIYQVTSTRIIDVERLPLFQREERREASLGMIQNISLEIPGFFGKVLNYGSVTIETAGAGAFTFDLVKDPNGVQSEIFRRVEAFQRRGEQQAAQRRRSELLDWFAVYDQMHRSAQPAPHPPISHQQES